MNLLLTNDDGYGSDGIEALYEALSAEHSVWIVAPSANRSGCSCGINMARPLRLEERGGEGSFRFSLDGTPADCVIAAVKGGFLPGRIDAVISGINRDGNLGTDIVYSGTCGAARQGAIYGVPSLALSVERMQGADGEDGFLYGAMARFAMDNLERLVRCCGERGEYFLNVNAPSAERFKGARWAPVCEREYNDYIALERADGCAFTSLLGGVGIESLGEAGHDQITVQEGYVSVSRIRALPVSEHQGLAEDFVCS